MHAGRALDGRAEEYSLACTAFELLCGTPPFGPDQGLGVQQLGGALGLAVIVTFAIRHASSEVSQGVNAAVAATNGYLLALRLCAIVMAVGAVIALVAFEKVDFIPPEKAAIEIYAIDHVERPDEN